MLVRSSALLLVPRYTVFPDIVCSLGTRSREQSAVALDSWSSSNLPPHDKAALFSFDINLDKLCLKSGWEQRHPGLCPKGLPNNASRCRLDVPIRSVG